MAMVNVIESYFGPRVTWIQSVLFREAMWGVRVCFAVTEHCAEDEPAPRLQRCPSRGSPLDPPCFAATLSATFTRSDCLFALRLWPEKMHNSKPCSLKRSF